MSDSHPSKAPNCANILYWGRHRICSQDLVEGLWLNEHRAKQRRKLWLARCERVLTWLGVIA